MSTAFPRAAGQVCNTKTQSSQLIHHALHYYCIEDALLSTALGLAAIADSASVSFKGSAILRYPSRQLPSATRRKGRAWRRYRYRAPGRSERSPGGELIAETLTRLHPHRHLFRLLFHSRVTEEAIREHAEVLAALNAGDATAASAAMERHIVFSRRRIAPIFDILD